MTGTPLGTRTSMAGPLAEVCLMAAVPLSLVSSSLLELISECLTLLT